MKNKLLLVLFLVCGASTLWAQNGDDKNWKWGDDPQRAKEQYTIFSDDVRAKSYKAALEPLTWLLENTPELNKSLYQKAARVYNGLLAEEKDDAAKKQYQDKALEMYDLRIKFFGEEADVLNIKGNYAASYWGTRPDKVAELYDLYTKIIELNKEKTFSRNMQSYMWLVSIMKNNNLKGVDENKVIEIHENLTKLIEKNIAKGEDKAEWEQTLEYVDSQYKALVTIDCAFINDKMIPKFEEVDESSDEYIKELENIVANMLKAECTDDPKFLEYSEKLAEKAPTFGRYQFLIRAYLAKKDFNKALELMDKSAPLAETDADKAEIYLSKARLKSRQGNKSGARAEAFKAASTDASKAYEAYTLVGDLYLGSGSSCKGSQPSNPCHAKAVYIAAYNMYIKAGNSAKAAKAQQYFPTKEEIFTHSMGGQAVNVGCWIGETVTIPNL